MPAPEHKKTTDDLTAGQPAPGYRLPAETHVGSLRLATGDLDTTVKFYQNVLGMRAERTATGAALFAGNSADEPLLVFEQQDGLRPHPHLGHYGLFHVAILLPSRADLGRFVRHLIEQEIRFGASDHLVSEAIYFSDPNGFGIEVYSDRPREQWRIDGNQIAMDTLPLDLDTVLAAAGDSTWSGMPDGTRVGHIHLRVGDLAQAEQFYHLALGLDKMVWTYPGALFMAAGGYHHHVAVNTWARHAGPAQDDEARLLEFTLVLPDQDSVTAAKNELADAGIPVEMDGSALVVADPWGTHVRLQAGKA